tara:strand:- start:440 stop:1123 length:684 start_codon:yes stop_codon:yes gene_type:complete
MKLYIDGPTEFEIKKFIRSVDGFTFNPSLFKKLGAKNYISFAKRVVKKCNNKPISIEVIADTPLEMIKQAKIISKLGKNVYSKIPIMFTNGKSTINVIEKLHKDGIKLNITAIFTLNQIKKILPKIKTKDHILSVFVGRIYDCGKDGLKIMREINKYVKKRSNCKTLWASCRMSYDYIKAKQIKTDIITMTPSQREKMTDFKFSLLKYSQKTVQQFYNDAKKAKFKI